MTDRGVGKVLMGQHFSRRTVASSPVRKMRRKRINSVLCTVNENWQAFFFSLSFFPGWLLYFLYAFHSRMCTNTQTWGAGVQSCSKNFFPPEHQELLCCCCQPTISCRFCQIQFQRPFFASPYVIFQFFATKWMCIAGDD